MIGVELFSGAGGMSLGASLAGVDIHMAVDIDKSASLTFKTNHPNALVVSDDIRNVDKIILKQNKKKQKILFGGPPCQGFSRSNHRTRNRNNDNNWLFNEFARVAQFWYPDWIVLENVEGLLGTDKGFFFEQILEKFTKLGYTLSYQVLNSVKFGVAQKRNRLFVVGSLHGVNYQFPEPTTTINVSVKEAINDLPILTNGNKDEILSYRTNAESEYAKFLRNNLTKCSNNGVSTNTPKVLERYKYIEQGGNWQSIPKDLMDSYKDVTRCHTGIYYRLNEDLPSVVIGNYRKNMLIHPNQDRGLSVREAARLQSFPDWFEFKGSLNEQQQQVGNAVPPLLAKAVFKQILES